MTPSDHPDIHPLTGLLRTQMLEWLILMIVIIIVLVVAVTIIIIRLLFFSVSTQPATNLGLAQLNYNCTENECDDGMICDPELRVCKLDYEQRCNNRYECRSESYCNLVCTSRDEVTHITSGITGDPCPCDYRTHVCVDGRCLSLYDCELHADCASNVCNYGECANLLPNGAACSEDIECESANCSQSICQMRGLETGQIGSTCNSDEMCNGLLVCMSDVCRIP